jgi:uracil-DNA glycosylase
MKEIKLEPSWKAALKAEFGKEYFEKLTAFVRSEYLKNKIYPKPADIFKAFELCPFDKVKVVILGQDPYHGPGQANGLCFAVHENIAVPPSLQNIYKEMQSDLGVTLSAERAKNGDLTYLAKQGVLLLNATLTVRADSPGSHQGKGWELFTDAGIQALSDQKENLVFILWGNYAKQKGKIIDRTKHLVLESPHPSPFSANNGFFGSRPFRKANAYLKEHKMGEIKWI